MDVQVSNILKENLGTFLVLVASLAFWYLIVKKPVGLPPGPRWTLPILGDLMSLVDKSDNGDARLPFRRLRKKYGDIFSVYLGPRLVVVINGYKAIKDALITNAEFTSHRPDILTNILAEHNGLFASVGDHSKEQRKAVLEVFRKIGKSTMEEKIQEEIGYFLERLREFDGREINIIKLVESSIANVIGSVVFGNRFEYEDALFQKFLQIMEENMKILGGTNIINYCPYLRYLPGDLFGVKKVMADVNYLENNIFKVSITEHMKHIDDNQTDDFIGAYIKEMKKSEKTGQKTTINSENLLKNVMDLFVAGTDTTASSVCWTILLFFHHPHVYEKCCKELQDVVGSGRYPEMKDKQNLPYIEATILEVLRYANVGLLGGPHAASQDIYIGGYFVPKGTMILANIDSVLCVDEEPWGDVAAFRPERFLNKAGDGIQLFDEFIPFSLGRRICIGESLARMELFLLITRLIQEFDLKPADPENLPPMQGTTGLTHSPKYYEILAVPRC